MEPLKLLLANVFVIGSILVRVSQAQSAPEDFLYWHNKFRSEEGQGLEPMAWNETVAAFARNYANQRKADCALIHSDPNTHPYGESIFMGESITAADAIKDWYGEKRFYDYKENACRKDPCGHYTQIVWRDSLLLGCARVKCDNQLTRYFINCNYYPSGNWEGKLPY